MVCLQVGSEPEDVVTLAHDRQRKHGISLQPLFFGADGTRLATYKKVHLSAAEREWYGSGDEPVVVETTLRRIGLTICYDFIFPEFVRRLVDLGAEIVINSTNWISDEFQRDTWGWTGCKVESVARTRARTWRASTPDSGRSPWSTVTASSRPPRARTQRSATSARHRLSGPPDTATARTGDGSKGAKTSIRRAKAASVSAGCWLSPRATTQPHIRCRRACGARCRRRISGSAARRGTRR